jgi:hypothetical protein
MNKYATFFNLFLYKFKRVLKVFRYSSILVIDDRVLFMNNIRIIIEINLVCGCYNLYI